MKGMNGKQEIHFLAYFGGFSTSPCSPHHQSEGLWDGELYNKAGDNEFYANFFLSTER